MGFIYEKYLLEYMNSLKMYNNALVIHRQILPENYAAIGSVLNKIGVIYRFQGEYKKALEHSLEALRLRKMVLDPNDKAIAETYNV